MHVDDIKQYRIVEVALVISLALAALAFSFSVAVTNIALALTLLIGVFSGAWWQGVRFLWQQHRFFMQALVLYLLFMPLGLLWSADKAHGLEVVGHLWFWLLLPVPVVALQKAGDRRLFLLCLSAGLALNLVYCVLQALGYVEVATDGSGLRDATGHIGHIGFGFVYALWASWLVYLGLQWHVGRWYCWGLALWACIMVFLAQGRAGYIMVILMLLVVLGRWLWQRYSAKQVISVLGGMLLLVGLMLVLGPAKERVAGTWMAWQGASHKSMNWQKRTAMLSTHERLDMWRTAGELWRKHPWFGVGTGGFVKAAKPLYAKMFHRNMRLSHPHNQYLLIMARWGTAGGILLLLLLFIWLRDGWQADWSASEVSSLVFLSGFALAIHGMFSISMEEHFSAILAVLLLSVAFSPQYAVHQARTKNVFL